MGPVLFNYTLQRAYLMSPSNSFTYHLILLHVKKLFLPTWYFLRLFLSHQPLRLGSPGELYGSEHVYLCEDWTHDVKKAVTEGSEPLKIMLIFFQILLHDYGIKRGYSK